jgi:hypothetical protein
MTKEDLVGVYRGLGAENVNKDGVVTSRRGSPNSQIMYSPDGFMGVLSTRAERKPVTETGRMDLDEISVAERAEAASDTVAYAGRYEVKDGNVYHHIDMALNPNLIGRTNARRIEMNGDDLTLCTMPDADGNYGRIRWRRVRGS